MFDLTDFIQTNNLLSPNEQSFMMTSVKIWSVLLPAAFLTIVPAGTEVVNSSSSCPGFLLEETLPLIPHVLEQGRILNQNRYKLICQTFKNRRRFLTLYDTNNKIPVFSAYKFTGDKDKNFKNPNWMIEPQVYFSDSEKTDSP